MRRILRTLLLATGLFAAMAAGAAQATTLLKLTITTALSATGGTAYQFQGSYVLTAVVVQCNLTYGSGGTTIDAYVQTSVDGGTTWIDVAECSYTTSSAIKVYNLSALTAITSVYTPTDGSLSANTSKDGIIGPRWRVKYKSTGTYAGGTVLQVDVYTRPLAVP